MEQTITITIPSSWLGDPALDQADLRRALQLGLAHLRQRQARPESTDMVVHAMLSTGRVRHLMVTSAEDKEPRPTRQEPPVLPGTPVSELLIAQRRGEL